MSKPQQSSVSREGLSYSSLNAFDLRKASAKNLQEFAVTNDLV